MEKLIDRKRLLAKVQARFNEFIRLRDLRKTIDGLLATCISCGRTWLLITSLDRSRYHAGHFYKALASENTALDEDNCHGQCSDCNSPRGRSGNQKGYKPNLIKKIGQERFDILTYKKNQIKNHTFSELEMLDNKYRGKIIEQKERLGLITEHLEQQNK